METLGDLIADEFSKDKVHLSDSEQRRLASMIDRLIRPAAQDRFFVDQRGGCVAVRDRQKTDPDYQGLHSDTEGVVWFRMGNYESREWSVRVCDREAADEFCRNLNIGNNILEAENALLAHAV